ncbi:hypothetical protein V1634_11285 [Plantactinospora veratri]|uniref:Uncharacterized protein n=1 Tax=Plantactinospora veratri TaxID=1436122 RepID=A0ABU7SBY4_9ACTN
MGSPGPPRQAVGWFRRTMCLLTLHTEPEMPHLTPVDPTNPCRRQPRCDCGRRRLPARTLHEYGEAGDGDRLCEQVKVCGRCGHEQRWLTHTTDARSVHLGDVPEHRRKGYDVYDCRYVALCLVCGDIAHLDERHDWHEDWWGRECRSCGLKFYDDD